MSTCELTLSREQAIRLLESAIGITFSEEQKRILADKGEHPLLINACAGSGKTTIFILLSLVQIMTGSLEPDNILGVTFSKKANLDMEMKYEKYCTALAEVGVNIPSIMPYFSTFHALFYRLLTLLDEYRDIQVISSWSIFTSDLSLALVYKDSKRTSRDQLNEIFQANAIIVNGGHSVDGLKIDTEISEYKTIKDVLTDKSRINLTKKFLINYDSVINKYIQLKRLNGDIDFNDMKTLLMQALKEPKSKKYLKKVMSNFRLAIIDEFQDIDPLQWKLINSLLSKETLNKIIAVGDDDQSVYAFRGSDPKYIINFQKSTPHAETLKLSTNYRTGGNILDIAKRMIENNHVRLPKKLLAFSSGQGKVNVFKTKSGIDYHSDFMEQLIHQIRDPQIDNSEIAILVRYNASRTLIADYLANRTIYTSLNRNTIILQKNNVYTTYIEITKALWYNKFSLIRKNATKIGFSDYKSHISQICNNAGKSRYIKLNKYLQDSKVFKNSLVKISKQDQSLFAKDRHLQDLLDLVKEVKDSAHDSVNSKNTVTDNVDIISRERTDIDCSDSKEPGIYCVFREVEYLVRDYYDYMISKNYISERNYREILDYLRSELKEVIDADGFFLKEEEKLHILSNKKKPSNGFANINFLSLHQSKGLEFEHVYLCDLNDKELKKDTLIINSLFSPTLTLDQFQSCLAVLDETSLFHAKNAFKKMKIESYRVLNRASFDFCEVRKELKEQPRLDPIFKKFYKSVISYSKFIEEERRLLYVGITRAKTELNLQRFDEEYPLLTELDLPLRDVFENQE